MKFVTVSDYIDDGVEGRKRTITFGGKLRVWWPFPIVSMLHSSSAMVLGVPVYGECRWIRPVHYVFKQISEAKYWVKYRVHPTQYHWVNTGMRPGYSDPCSVLLYASMAVLKRYIDEMGGLEEIDKFNAELRDPKNNDSADEEVPKNHQADDQEEAATIWRWWTEQLPADKKRRDDMMHELFAEGRITWKPVENGYSKMVCEPWGDKQAMYDEFRALEKKIDEDKQSMLHRLVDIRESLWT